MKKRIVVFTVLVLTVVLGKAHEFWLQPKKFVYAKGEEMKVDFKVGENFDGEPWDLKKHGIEKLVLYQAVKTTDLRAAIRPEAKDKLTIKLMDEGSYMLVMESKNDYIELDAEKFNTYLKDDGLEEALEQRTKTNTLDRPSREFYARFVKLIVQAGGMHDDTYKRKAGLRLEIMPGQNPYLLKPGDHLQCTVLYEGKPSPHQLVKVWNKIGNTTFVQNIYTEDDGTIRFPVSAEGTWMVSTVKMIPADKPGADWQSLWGSLVFGIQ
jgi:uncharacterized GH25 family protein